SRLRLLASPARLAAVRDRLALMPEVFWLDLESRRVLLNDTTVWVAQSGTAGGQATPVYNNGIHGEGQVIGILDTGIDPDMCYFRDAALGLPPTNACNGGTVVNTNQRKVIAVDFLWSTECAGGIASNEWDTQDHGSHVAGSAAGDNLANPITHDTGDGVAPGAKLVIQDCGFQTNNCADCPGIGCPVVDLNPIFQQPYTQGARIHTNSWGDDENNPTGGYTAGSQDADEFMWNHKDFLLLFAAGNSGPGTTTVYSPSTGKNVVSVGATLRGTSAESMASFSSCGPSADGRIKPDITMPGSSIVSANSDNNTGSNNCNTLSLSGTSMASPATAGAAALVRQYFTDGFYPTGAAVGGNAFTPSAALIKAALINSGHDMTSVTDIPSNCQGWGRVLLDNVLYFPGDSRDLAITDDTTGFAQGSSNETRSYNFDVAAGEAFKVTLVWTDYPSTPASSVHLINDLDLEVSGPGGTFKGNVFSAGQSATGGVADRKNNVEQVLLKTPTAGSYTVTVRSFTVPNGPQPFALVVTGNLSGGPAPTTVFSDTFETDLGWTRNASGTDTATAGLWERGDPEATNSSGAKQLGTTVSGTNDLVTGRLAGSSAGVHDLDGGVSSMRSPAIALPTGGTLTLSFSYYLAHANNSSTADYLRVFVVGTTTTTVLEELGANNDDDAVWALRTVDISAYGGQTVRILVEANDSATASLVEAAIDDVAIVHQP
ncbi:MAG: S8 family serine peptidase, partial [Thermoanaerobaculia bacterium]|nr:S8 family serine peptidase [Thermoanaerobaculia bacterium]